MVENTLIISESGIVNATNETTDWAFEWLGYGMMGLFTMILVFPTLGIFSMLIYEYFSEEAERKAERQRDIDEVMEQAFGNSPNRDGEEHYIGTTKRRHSGVRRRLNTKNYEKLSDNESDDELIDDFEIKDFESKLDSEYYNE